MKNANLRNIIREELLNALKEQEIPTSPFSEAEEKFLAKFAELGSRSLGILYTPNDVGIREFLGRSGKDFNLTPDVLYKLMKDGIISIVPYGGYARNQDYTLQCNLELDELEGLSSGDDKKDDAGGDDAADAATTTEESVETSKDLANLLVTEQKRHTSTRVYTNKSRTLRRLPKGYVVYLEKIIKILGQKLRNDLEKQHLVADILDNLAHNFGLTPKQVYRSFIFYNSQNRLKNVVQESAILNEQGGPKPLEIPLSATFDSGKYKQLPNNFKQELNIALQGKIKKFLETYKNNEIQVTIEAGESQVTNFDNEVSPAKEVKPGYLSQKRGANLKAFLNAAFSALVKEKALLKVPTIDIKTVIGDTKYIRGTSKANDPKYKEEQYVKLIISVKGDLTTKKPNPCIFDLSFTIAYDKGNSHTCDQAIFELIANGVNLGICNLNNSWKDEYTQSGQQGPMSIANEYNKKDMVSYAVEQNAVGGKSRGSDGQKGGSRSQEYIIGETLALQILKNSPRNWAPKKVIKFELQPLVGRKGRYSMFYNWDAAVVPGSTKKGQKVQPQGPGSHGSVPRVIIKNKEGVEIYNKKPSVTIPRNSMKKSRILIVDECGKPIGKSA